MHFNLLQTSTNMGEIEKQQHLGNKIESGKYIDIEMGFGNCSNSRTINELQVSFGELLRVGTMGSITWINELCREACHLVLAHPYSMYQVPDHVKNDFSLMVV